MTPQRLFPAKPLISKARVAALEPALHATDDPLLTLFADDITYYTSSGMGQGTLWPFRVGECALAVAEQMVRISGDTLPEVFIEKVLENLNAMRALCTDGTAEVPALISYENVVVPPGVTLHGPRDAILRAATDRDPRPPVASDATMVLETKCTVSLSIGPMPPPADDEFWLGTGELRAEELLVGLAGLLATASQEQRGMPLLRATRIFDPFQPYLGWFQPLPAPGRPSRRTNSPISRRWLLRLAQNYHPSIRVAVKRCITSFSDRPDSDDALIDLVIALENLLVTRGPQLRQRMAAGLGTRSPTPRSRANPLRRPRDRSTTLAVISCMAMSSPTRRSAIRAPMRRTLCFVSWQSSS